MLPKIQLVHCSNGSNHSSTVKSLGQDRIRLWFIFTSMCLLSLLRGVPQNMGGMLLCRRIIDTEGQITSAMHIPQTVTTLAFKRLGTALLQLMREAEAQAALPQFQLANAQMNDMQSCTKTPCPCQWDQTSHFMRVLGRSGAAELFVGAAHEVDKPVIS